MGSNISIYLSNEALQKLDEAVARRAVSDKAHGKSGRQVASRSSILQALIEEGLGSGASLDLATIRYYVVLLAEEYGAEKVSLFGSYAVGEQRDDSDVDLLLDKGRIRGMQVLDFQEALAEKLGRPVDVVTTAGASPRFLEKIRENEVVLYEAS